MRREGQAIEQPRNQPVDVANWTLDEEFGVYPEGARDKSLLYPPATSDYAFLIPGHRYLFKHAFRRHPDQFWAEIMAYRIGCLIGAAVPPVFVAWDSDSQECGALIEWFLDYPNEPEERYVTGGDIMASMIRGYDRKRGSQHNFQTVERFFVAMEKAKVFRGNWRAWWCDTLLLDALIGNTDRHQDNWGLLWYGIGARMAPAFDNGTSLGYEIIPRNMGSFSNPDRMERYIRRGTHHMRWHASDPHPARHVELLEELVSRHPELRSRVSRRLSGFNVDVMRRIIYDMVDVEIPVRLHAQRAEFVCALTEARLRNLITSLSAP